jgi:hypothetical protein
MDEHCPIPANGGAAPNAKEATRLSASSLSTFPTWPKMSGEMTCSRCHRRRGTSLTQTQGAGAGRTPKQSDCHPPEYIASHLPLPLQAKNSLAEVMLAWSSFFSSNICEPFCKHPTRDGTGDCQPHRSETAHLSHKPGKVKLRLAAEGPAGALEQFVISGRALSYMAPHSPKRPACGEIAERKKKGEHQKSPPWRYLGVASAEGN